MTNHFEIQAYLLQCGIINFEPVLNQIHQDFNKEDPLITDWPSVSLATTLLTTVVSLFKLLPPPQPADQAIDRRSIATIIRNIVDTHDALYLLCKFDDSEKFNLNRDILGYYLVNRKMLISEKLEMQEAQSLIESKDLYWNKIKESGLDKNAINRLISGETIFYESRYQRVLNVCGEEAKIVQGILADISTYVHSISPALWFNSLEDGFDDNIQNRDMLAIWLRLGNFYFAKSIEILIRSLSLKVDDQLKLFLDHNIRVFGLEEF